MNLHTIPSGKKLTGWAETVIVLILMATGFAVRLYDLTDPPLDFYSPRQLRSAIITRSFYYESLNNSDPTIVEQADKLADLERYEPPVMEWLVSKIDLLIGKEVFWTGRIFSAFFWALGGLFLYRICRRFASFSAGIFSLLIYYFVPFSIIASRSFQPDPWMCFWVLGTAWMLCNWSEKGSWSSAFFSGFIGGMALLVKIYAGFFVAFMLLGIFCASVNRQNRKQRIFQTLLIGAVMLIPSAVYYLIFNPSRSGDFFSFWIVSLSGLIRTSNFYADWIAMVKGLIGLVLPLFGLWGVLFIRNRQVKGLMIGWWLGYIFYGLFVPYQITTHEYYSLILIPLTAISVCPVSDTIFEKTRQSGKIAFVCSLLLIMAAVGYGAYSACGYLRGTNYVLEPASWRKVGEAIPQNEPFIALTGDYGMRLIYYGWRQPSLTWPDAKDDTLFQLAGTPQADFDTYFDSQTKGMNYFVVTALGELDNQPDLKKRLESFPVYAAGNGYIIYDLRNKP